MKTHKQIKTAVSVVAAGIFFAGLSSAALAQGTPGTLFVVDDAVGIGTDTINTGSKLHVLSSSTGAVDGIFLENQSGPSRIKLTNRAIVDSATENQEWQLNSNGSFRISRKGGGVQMRLDAAGNMEVQGSLSVAGNTLTIPDYVFESDYELRPLSEVQTYIQQNKHLPDVPSAEDVRKDGLNMTEMQIVLLQKVEELTLYTIQQQETIEDLQSKLDHLSN